MNLFIFSPAPEALALKAVAEEEAEAFDLVWPDVRQSARYPAA